MGIMSNVTGFFFWTSAAVLLTAPFLVAAQQDQDNGCFTPDLPQYCRNRIQSVDVDLDCSAPSCQIPAQLDFYGLGVRLGVYFAWLASWLANNFVVDEMAGTLDTNAVFLLSLTTTVIVQTVNGSIFLVDSLILIQLGFGFVFGVMSLWGYRTRYYKSRHPGAAAGEKDKYHFGGWGTHCRLALCTLISCYALWFWVYSVANPNPNCFLRERCDGLRTFVFTSVSIMGWTRWIHALGAAVCVIYYGVAFIVAMVTFARYLINGLMGREMEWIPQYIDESERRVITIPYICLSALTALWLIFTVFCVEFTLNFNHVAGALAGQGNAVPGQLLPLLVGLFSVVRIFWIMYKQRTIEPAVRKAHSLPESPTSPQMSARPNRWSAGQRQSSFLVGLITAWLPWLNCYDMWRQHTKIERRSTRKFYLLPEHQNDGEEGDALKLRAARFESIQGNDLYE